MKKKYHFSCQLSEDFFRILDNKSKAVGMRRTDFFRQMLKDESMTGATENRLSCNIELVDNGD